MEAGDLDKSFRRSFDGSLRLMERFFGKIGDVLNLVFLTVSLVSGSLCRLQVAALAGLLPSYCVVVTVVFRIPCHSMKLFYVRATCELFASKYS